MFSVIGNKLDSVMMTDILKSLCMHFRQQDKVEKLHDLLIQLTLTSRFNIIRLFLTKSDKENFEVLSEFLDENNKSLSDEIRQLYL